MPPKLEGSFVTNIYLDEDGDVVYGTPRRDKEDAIRNTSIGRNWKLVARVETPWEEGDGLDD